MNDFTLRLVREDAVLVSVASAQGSVPREVGAWMAVFAGDTVGTVGGGRLELDAIARARRLFSGWCEGDGEDRGSALARSAASADAHHARAPIFERVLLGPSLGQCCGGAVELRYERVGAADAQRLRAALFPVLAPVVLFGGGHVGRAIVRALGLLPFSLRWVDSRDEIFPDDAPANVRCEHSDPVAAAVADAPAGARILVMSFSHAEDLEIVAACLKRQRARADLPYVGLIGSRTKWATFRHRLEARGFTAQELAHITCPIGVPGVVGKEPEVIAAAVAAQLLQLPR